MGILFLIFGELFCFTPSFKKRVTNTVTTVGPPDTAGAGGVDRCRVGCWIKFKLLSQGPLAE